MAVPSEKLARSLDALKALQDRGMVAIRSSDLGRLDRERLVKNGFLQPVMKGWYIPSRPDELAGESTAWYASFWDFCGSYLNERFGTDWCLSPEQSLLLHAENCTVPRQLLVRSPRGDNKITGLPHDTSLLTVRYSMPDEQDIEVAKGLNLYALVPALIDCTPRLFQQNPTDIRAALSIISDASEILAKLLQGGHTTIAGRLAGAFRNIGRDRIADDIVKTMRAADYDVRESDPFETKPPVILSGRERSPHVNRIHLMWHAMREPVIERFPEAPGIPEDIKTYLQHIDDVYVTDAYHSLSIEGYRVSAKLIEHVRNQRWNPDKDEDDGEQRNAMAARGYYQAFLAVKESITKVLNNDNPGIVVDDGHGAWYRELFAPGVTAGILQIADLAGYRNDQVYIRHSLHTPPNREAVRDLMPALFDLIKDEKNPAVRVVLGHFMFVYIHPYMDGNGRMGRFLMNVMLAAGGYPWTVIPVEMRNAYMDALEAASTAEEIAPFTDFLATLVRANLEGKPGPTVP
ncbi:MAG: Fic family protein [Gammaproteobacteria bacterium]|nr:MAG: Fic family protein [Gammaproteobacteria bacterium]